MKKIMIIGCPGAGKSVFSKRLAKKLDIPLYHMDNLFWNSDKTNVGNEVLYERVQEIIQRDSWIIDGNYQGSLEMRMKACDTIFFLDYSLEVCLNGAKERMGTVRSDMPWVEEKEDPEFIQFIIDFHEKQVPVIYELLDKYKDKEIHIFHSRDEALNYLNMEDTLIHSITLNGKEFSIIKLLGHGKGGYSYLAQRDGKSYVLKKIHHEPCSYYTFGNKIEAENNDYHRLLDTGIRIPKMLDIDFENELILKEYIDGPTISSLVEKKAMKPEYLEQVKEMSKMCRQKNLNIDYYPTNFCVQDGLIYYIDYECNPFMEEWSFETWGIQYWNK